MIGFVIGNGTSRRGYDLNHISGHGITVGCNGLYKHYSPDYLVTLDQKPTFEVGEYLAKKPGHFQWITRGFDAQAGCYSLVVDGIQIKLFKEINRNHNNNSGLVACDFLASVLRVKKIFLLGIDFFLPVPDEESNDLYSRNTVQSPSLVKAWNFFPVDYPDTRFIRVGTIHDRDKHFFNAQLQGYEYMQTFEEMHAELRTEASLASS